MPEYRNNNAYLHEADAFIGQPPSWLLRSGISLFAFVIICVLSLTYFIQYPDKIRGVGYMTAENPPIKLITKVGGYVENLNYLEGQQVEKGDTILYIHNTTNVLEIQKIEEWISAYQLINAVEQYPLLPPPENLQLGMLQGDYSNLVLSYSEFIQTLNNNLVRQQISSIQEEIMQINQLNASQKVEKGIFQEELTLELKKFKRNNEMLKEGIISAQERETAETALLQKKRQYAGLENGLIQNQIRIQQLQFDRLRIMNEQKSKIDNHIFSINEIVARLHSATEDWYQNFGLIAPAEGVLTFTSIMTLNKAIKAEELVGHIMPEDGSRNFFRVDLPLTNAGKVKEGQTVLIKLDAYPYKEFGMLNGKISRLSAIPIATNQTEFHYEVFVSMDETLKTDTGKSIPYRPDMTAQIEIITERKTILLRIFDQFLSLIKQQEI